MSFGQVHPVFSVTLLCPYDDEPIAEHQECHPLPPPLVIRNGVKEYEVGKILNSWIFRSKEYACGIGHAGIVQMGCYGVLWCYE